MSDESKRHPTPWAIELGTSANHREGYYVVDRSGRALWDNGGDDGGVCYDEETARLLADAWRAPTLKQQRDEAVAMLQWFVTYTAPNVAPDATSARRMYDEARALLATIEKETP